MFAKLLKEPLIQFFVAGFFLYTLYALVGDSASSQLPQNAKKTIYLSAEHNDSSDMKIKEYEAVLLNEAYFLKLYEQDRDISAILIEKMEYILANSATLKEPSETQLLAFYKKHIQDYAHIKTLSFYLYDVHEKFVYRDIYNLLHLRPKGGIFEQKQSLAQIEQKYGSYFAHKISQEAIGYLSDSIHAKHKDYLVFLQAKDVAKPLDFNDVESRVYQDYIYQKRLELKKQAYDKIKQHYEIKLK